MNWNDIQQRIRECVAADIENGNHIYRKAHIRRTTKFIYPLGELVFFPMLEFVPEGWASDDDICDYAHEFADGAPWVIYTDQARSLWANSWEVSYYEDAYGYNGDKSIDENITTCVYLATREAVHAAIEDIRNEMEASCVTA